MRSVIVDSVSTPNIPKLDGDIRAACPNYTGFSIGKRFVLHFEEGVSDAEIATAVGLVRAHDPNLLTPEQQEQQERQQKLVSLRDMNRDDLDLADYTSEKATFQTLAQKLAWLEQEVLELRGGRDG